MNIIWLILSLYQLASRGPQLSQLRAAIGGSWKYWWLPSFIRAEGKLPGVPQGEWILRDVCATLTQLKGYTSKEIAIRMDTVKESDTNSCEATDVRYLPFIRPALPDIISVWAQR
jgi:hypothetical protein